MPSLPALPVGRFVATWRQSARAVVAVRLGLTITNVDIRRRRFFASGGKHRVEDGILLYGCDRLPPDLATEPMVMLARAIVDAASRFADQQSEGACIAAGSVVGDRIRQLGTQLGHDALDRFVDETTAYAGALLVSTDYGAGWARVREELERCEGLVHRDVLLLLHDPPGLTYRDRDRERALLERSHVHV
jgi:hypothetical protein